MPEFELRILLTSDKHIQKIKDKLIEKGIGNIVDSHSIACDLKFTKKFSNEKKAGSIAKDIFRSYKEIQEVLVVKQ